MATSRFKSVRRGLVSSIYAFSLPILSILPSRKCSKIDGPGTGENHVFLSRARAAGPEQILPAHRATPRRRAPILDLTESNPTRCDFQYDVEGISRGLALPASLVYEPHPQGLATTRAAIAAYYAEQGVGVDPDPLSHLGHERGVRSPLHPPRRPGGRSARADARLPAPGGAHRTGRAQRGAVSALPGRGAGVAHRR